MKVDLLDVMGDDLTVVNAARVSYAKHTDEFRHKDWRLLQFLADEGHHSPFFHPQLTFRITCAIQVARQLMRHQVGLAVNEVSRRYVRDAPDYDMPKHWRNQDGDRLANQAAADVIFDRITGACDKAYSELLDLGVSKEQARYVLPQAMQTQFIWTGSLFAFARVCRERLADDAQKETAAVAAEIYMYLKERFPKCAAVLLPDVGCGDDV